MQCPQCGIYNRPGAHYCNQCGGTFQQSQTDDSPPARIPKFIWVGLTIIGLLVLGFMDYSIGLMARGPNRTRVSMSTVSGSIKLTPVEALPTPSSATSSPASAEAQKLNKETAPEIAIRERLKESFRLMIASAKPHLKYIGSEITGINSGYALWATNESFSRDSFSKGEDAKIVSAWMAQNRADLQKANIVRVGLTGKGPSSSFCWLDLK